MGQVVLAGLRAGATTIYDSGSLSAARVGVFECSEEERSLSEIREVCTVDPASTNYGFFGEIGRAEGQLLLSQESRDESRILSVSEKKLLVTRFMGSIQNTVSSEVFESAVSIVKYFKLISVLLY